MTVDWGEVFRISVPPLELMVRGSAVYWFLFLVFRLLLRRDVGSIGIADILVLVIVADAAQNGMTGDYKSVTDAFVLISTIIGWNVLVDWLSFRSPFFRRLLQPAELLLIRDGVLLMRNMRKEFLTEDELMAKLRDRGIESVSEVKRAYMESDGTITVIERKSRRGAGKEQATPATRPSSS